MASWWLSSPLMVAPVVSSIMSTIKKSFAHGICKCMQIDVIYRVPYRIKNKPSHRRYDREKWAGGETGRDRGWESGLDVSNKAVFSPCRGKTPSEIRREQSTGESPVRHDYNPPKNLCNSATSEWPPLALHLSNFQFFSEKPPLTSGSSWKLAVCRSRTLCRRKSWIKGEKRE